MPWMRMPDQTWSGVAAGFLSMWTVMMVAMMTPVIAPQILRHRRAFGNRSALMFALAYFGVWVGLGLLVFPIGVLWAEASGRVPVLSGAAILLAGATQFTGWKRRALACCRGTADRQGLSAWRSGLGLGLHCIRCCANLTALLLVIGVMNLGAMVLVTAFIAVERLAPSGHRWARGTGALIVMIGVWSAVSLH